MARHLIRLSRLNSAHMLFCAVAFVVFAALLGTPVRCWGETKLTAEQERFFEAKVRPLLVERCYRCHSEGKQREGGLLLDRREGLLQGGDSGPAVSLESPKQSLLLLAVRRDERVSAMPPDDALSNAEVAILSKWVEMGLPDPRGQSIPKQIDPLSHWAFQLPERPLPPTESASDWARGPLDALVLRTLNAAQVAPSTEANAATIVRRLAYDLTGLPPAEDLLSRAAMGLDEREYRQIVDELLATPQFGERWGRYWLDLARYADTKGYVFREDRAYKKAYLYRDWVIRSLNQDLPYDQFLKTQLAADQLFPDDSSQWAAMGFLTLGRRFLNNIHDIIDDRIDVVSRGTMGLTVSCARCHDHKYDPIPTQDYYSLYSIFWSSDEPKDDQPRRLVDRDKPRDIRVFVRGSAGNRGELAPRGFLRVLNGGEPRRFADGSGRLQLAESIASPDNPLTARVFVNRVWGRLFGAHLVETPSDFGVRTSPSAHADVLDYLAVEFVENRWSVKRLVREIVCSSTYRQSSAARPDLETKDPENRLFTRMNRRRLDFESMRDTVLSVANELDCARVGGVSEKIEANGTRRRSVYAHIDRQNLPALFRAFDFATPDTHNPKRAQTTVPQQALFLLNSPFMLRLAEAMAKQSEHLDHGSRAAWMFQRAYGRSPSDAERRMVATMLATADKMARREAMTGWKYGYGERVKDQLVFHPLPTFAEGRYQGGPKLPDPKLGWAMLNAAGGHPEKNRPVMRRWTAPSTPGPKQVELTSVLERAAKLGDGIQARLLSSRQGELGRWEVRTGKRPIELSVAVEPGEVLDFVVDVQETVAFDGFNWPVKLVVKEKGSVSGRWDSRADFANVASRSLDPWSQLAQALLISNELQFLD